MKNVMTKAWEIARKGAADFGGKASEYIAEALRMAWDIVKKAMDKIEIGFQDLGNKNETRWFVTNDIDGLRVSFLTAETNPYNGKEYMKSHPINDYQTGVNNKTGQEIRMYNVRMNCGDIEIKLNDQTEVMKNSYDAKKWGL